MSRLARLFAALLALAVAPAARAEALAVGGGWQSFAWDAASSLAPFESPFTLIVARPSVLRVTDAFVPGDRFRLALNGADLGDTSVPSGWNADWNEDPELAMLNPEYSSGTFLVGPGTYALDIAVIETADGYTEGGAFLRLDVALPEPGTLALAGLGVAAALGLRRRRG